MQSYLCFVKELEEESSKKSNLVSRVDKPRPYFLRRQFRSFDAQDYIMGESSYPHSIQLLVHLEYRGLRCHSQTTHSEWAHPAERSVRNGVPRTWIFLGGKMGGLAGEPVT